MIDMFLSATPADAARACMIPAMVLLIVAGAAVVNLLTPKPLPEREHTHRLQIEKLRVAEDLNGDKTLSGSCEENGCKAKVQIHVPRIHTGIVPFPKPKVARLDPTDPRVMRHRNN